MNPAYDCSNDLFDISTVRQLLAKMKKRSRLCVEAEVSVPLHSCQLGQRKRIVACCWEELIERLHGLGIHIPKPSLQHVISKYCSLEWADNRNEDRIQRSINSKVNGLLNLVRSLTGKADHEEPGDLDVVLPCPKNCLLSLIHLQVFPNEPLVVL